jgi:uncharacterized protein HemY
MEAESRRSRHEIAVLNTLRGADAAAERGDYADALSWLETVSAIGDALPEEYEHKRRAWSATLASLTSKKLRAH